MIRFRLTSLFCVMLALGLVSGIPIPSSSHADEAPPASPPAKPLISTPSQNVCLGPIEYVDASPFQLLRVTNKPGCVDTFVRGNFLLSGAVSWNNRWGDKPGRYFIDGEFLQFRISAGYGITDWLMVRLDIPFGIRGGGIMDSAIMGFHDAFGYVQAGRDRFPLDSFGLVLWRPDGTLYRLGPDDAGAGMEDLGLSAKFRLTNGGTWVPLVYFSLNMTLPTGSEDELWGIGTVSGGPMLSLAKRIWRFYLYGDLQYTAYASGDLVGIPMNQNQFSALGAIEWSIVQRCSLILQYQFNSGAARDFYEFSSPTNQVGLGCKVAVARETVLSFGLLENAYFYDNSPDFAVQMNAFHKF